MLMPKQRRTILTLRLNLAFASAVGLLVLCSYLKEPSEPGSAVLFGFSYLRLALILVVLALLMGILILLLGSFRSTHLTQQIENLFARLSNQKWAFWIAIIWMAASYVLLFLSEPGLGSFASYRERLLPILIWFAVLSVQFGFVTLYVRGMNPGVFHVHRSLLVLSFIVLTLFGLLLLGIQLTRVGLTPDDVYWQGPGAPVLLHQVLLAAFAGVLFYLLLDRTNLARSSRLDIIVFLVLWGFASLTWLNQPADLTYFSLEPKEPNFQAYPFSDALLYDSTAQEFLIGKPIPGDFWVKPLYSLFLALLHLISENDYALLISLQVVILAIIPSLVYGLTSSLDARPAGLVAALLIIFREQNAMALSNVIQVSHSKLLLSDVFAMGEMVLLVWLVIWWLGRPAERRAAPMAVGGMSGLLILTRGHPILIVPFLFLVSFIVLKPNLKLWYEGSLRIVIGLSLVLLPWLWHIFQLTGEIGFQDPTSRYAGGDWLVQAYSQPIGAGNAGSESSASYGAFQSQVFRFFIEHPVDVIRFVSAHYFHNTIFSYIYLPGSFQIEGLRSYVSRMPMWGSWDGSISSETGMLIILNLAILSLGIGTAWRKSNKLFLAPLILGIAYNLSLAVSRRSGWRFILPADWITLIFYAIGLIQIVVMIRLLTKPSLESLDERERIATRALPMISAKQSPVMFGLPFFLIALATVAGHYLFPLRFPAKSADELLKDYQKALQVNSGTEPTAIENLLHEDGAVILYGRALYPVYLRPNEGMLNYYWLSYASKPYSRLAFHMIGPQPAEVILPMGTPPATFPDGADVIVIGCLAETGEVNASSVLIQGATPIHYTRDLASTPTCPFFEPE